MDLAHQIGGEVGEGDGAGPELAELADLLAEEGLILVEVKETEDVVDLIRLHVAVLALVDELKTLPHIGEVRPEELTEALLALGGRGSY